MADFPISWAIKWYRFHLSLPLWQSIPLVLIQGLALAVLGPIIAGALFG